MGASHGVNARRRSDRRADTLVRQLITNSTPNENPRRDVRPHSGRLPAPAGSPSFAGLESGRDAAGSTMVCFTMKLQASRKPRLLFRFDGVFLLRFAERQFAAVLFQLPPRFTRSAPDAGPCGRAANHTRHGAGRRCNRKIP